MQCTRSKVSHAIGSNAVLSMLLQGTSQTMEDALELGRAVALHGLSPEALAAYEAAR